MKPEKMFHYEVRYLVDRRLGIFVALVPRTDDWVDSGKIREGLKATKACRRALRQAAHK